MARKYGDPIIDELASCIENMTEIYAGKKLEPADIVVRDMMFESAAKDFVRMIVNKAKEEVLNELMKKSDKKKFNI